jgi:hypothetical protein
MTDLPSYEELAAPRPSRAGQVLAVMLALLVAVVVVIRIAASGSSTDRPVSAAPTPIAAPTIHPVPFRPVPERIVVMPRLRHVPRCPRGTDRHVACTTYRGLAAPTARALHERFRHIVVEHAVTKMLRPTDPADRSRLWSRAITARVGALTLRIAVRRADSEHGVTTGMQLGKRLQLIRYYRGHYLVDFELRGPVDPRSLSPTISWLLTEPRLVRPAVARGGTIVG